MMLRLLSSPHSYRQFAVAVVLSLSSVLAVSPIDVGASALLPMSVGAADMSLNGSNIAEPLSPSGALFANPAGLCEFDRTTATGSIGYGFGSNKIHNEDGYSQNNDLWAVIPDFAVTYVVSSRLRYAVGMYGSVGASYDFPADPASGVDNDFHAETSIIAMPLGIAYRVSDQFYLGAELILLGGHLRNRYTVGGQEFRYTLRGPGLQGMLGLTWKPNDAWSLGLGVQTPGIIWMDGSTVAPAGVRRDVDLDLEMPMQVSLGFAHHLTPATSVFGSARWTDSSRFDDSDIQFDGMPSADVPFLPDAKDEWRYALGMQITTAPGWKLRAGVSKSNRIVGTRGASPLVFDNEDFRASAGIGIERGDWEFDTTIAYSFHDGRDVSSSDALVMQGHYNSGGGIAMVGITRRFGQ